MIELDLLRTCQIDPLPCHARLGQGFVIRNATLQFVFALPSPII